MKKLRDDDLLKWIPKANVVDYEIHWDAESGK